MEADIEQNKILETTFFDVKMKSPILVASGPIGDSEESINKWFDAGIGGVITKTITTEKASFTKIKGTRKIIKIDEIGALNASTYSKRSLNEWTEILQKFVEEKKIVIPNIFERTPIKLAETAKKIAKSNCKALELGISCPNDDDKFEMTPKYIGELVKVVKEEVSCKLIVKLPAFDNYLQKVEAAILNGADAISISDTLPGIHYDINLKKLWFNGPAGYSGKGIKPLVLNAIYNIRMQGFKMPILGIGGIETSEDVIEYMHFGVSCVQICTALMYGKYKKLNELNEGIASWCSKNKTNISKIKPLI